MNLSAETGLRRVMETLNERIIPVLPDGFAVEVMRLAGLVMAISTNSIDGAVTLRVAENAAMRTLFRDAAPVVSNPALTDALQQGAASVDSGLKISQLDRDNNALRTVLVQLHEHVEQIDSPAARAIDSRIWRMLQAFEAERAPRR